MFNKIFGICRIRLLNAQRVSYAEVDLRSIRDYNVLHPRSRRTFTGHATALINYTMGTIEQ